MVVPMNAQNWPSINFGADPHTPERCLLTPRGGRWLMVALLGTALFASGLVRNARSEAKPDLAAIIAERAPDTLSDAERLIALYRFVQEDIRQIDTRYG